MKDVEAPTCEKDLKKFLGKVNCLRRFISNLSGKINAFTPILRLKNETEFTWGQNSKRSLKRSRSICLHHLCSRRLGEGFLSGFMWLLKIMSLGLFDSRTEDKEYVISYISRRLIDAETRYIFTEKLCLSLYYACTKLRHYLLSSICIVVC